MSDKIKSLLKKKKRITLDDYPSIRDSLDITISNREIFRLIQEHVFKIDNTPIEIKLPKEFEFIDNQFKFLCSIPEIEQKSEEWHNVRHNMITASSCAEALGESKYQSKTDCVIKKCLPLTFEPTLTTHHGTKFEQVATQIYEEIFDTSIYEFGLIQHPSISFLGASPDGICDKMTRHNKKKFSNKYGTMLEIKCPKSRVIKKTGKIDGDICPHYYYVQCQVQLETCELDTCDFWQCKLTEYATRDEWIMDTPKEVFITEGVKIENPKLLKGAIIQFLPREEYLNGNLCVFNAKYLYAPSLDMTCLEYENWIMSVIYNLHNTHKDIWDNYIFDKVIYWKLEDCHVQEIKRDKEWFASAKPRLETFWDEVMFYRNNPDKLKELQKKNFSFDSA
jgi:putative phage-type endonuclease